MLIYYKQKTRIVPHFLQNFLKKGVKFFNVAFTITGGRDACAIIQLHGIADIDANGIADLILIGHGDFGGKYLLIEQNSHWQKIRDDWPGPC